MTDEGRFAEAVEWLYSTQMFGIKLGLENIRRLLAESVPAHYSPRIVHVAGTNGKGSTCAMVDAICRAAGHRTGLFTSPHLVSFAERIRVDGAMIPVAEAGVRLHEIRRRVSGWDPHPTFFEIATALAVGWFRDSGAEVVVLETGMGGRLDATNALTAAVSVITPVALDHMQWLGDTIELIAGEKAGIIKRGVPVVSAPQLPAALEVIRRAAAKCESRLEVIEAPWTSSRVALEGGHQRLNAAVAAATVRAGGIEASEWSIRRGLAAVEWPGRFQRLGPCGRVIIDGAHNPAGAAAVAATYREIFGDEQAVVIYGGVTPKDHGAIVSALRGIAARWIFTTLSGPRAVPAADLAALVPGSSMAQSVDEALDLAGVDPMDCIGAVARPPVLICGSLYLAGEALALLRGEAGKFEASAQ